MKREGKVKKIIIYAVLLVLVWLMLPNVSVKAATTYPAMGSVKKSGRYTVYRTRESGRIYGSLRYRVNSGSTREISTLVSGAVVIGKNVYYSKLYNRNDGTAIRKFNMETGRDTYLGLGSGKYKLLMGYYNGKLYLKANNEYTQGETMECFNIKKGRSTVVYGMTDVGSYKMYKNYIVAMGTRGDPSPTSLRVYNMNTGKVKKLSSLCSRAQIVGGKLYYSVVTSTGSYPIKYRVTFYRCNLSGSSKVKLKTVSNGHYIPPVFKKGYVAYMDGNYNYKKYYYSSKRTVGISRETFFKLGGGKDSV